jgi:predicted RNA-binding Zn-ribbon protein involved in translation (DUF1610 family)
MARTETAAPIPAGEAWGPWEGTEGRCGSCNSTFLKQSVIQKANRVVGTLFECPDCGHYWIEKAPENTGSRPGSEIGRTR